MASSLKRGAVRPLMARLTFMVMACGLLAHVACSDDEQPATPPSGVDGGNGGNDSGPSGDDGSADAGCADPPLATVDCSFDGGADDSGADGGLPGDIRCTGLYACFSTKAVAANAHPYKPGPELWSDGAEKSRWIVLPAGTKVDATDPDNWVFPTGTKVFKEFKVDGKRVETRLLEKTAPGRGISSWSSTVYRWAADGESSARRLDTGEQIGSYQVPPSTMCIRCHSGSADMLLGVEYWSLGVAGATGLTIARMKELALLEPAPAAATLTIPEDNTGKAAAALSWLHANCGMCHNDGTGSARVTGLFLDLPPTTSAGAVTSTPTYVTGVDQPMRAASRYQATFPGLLRIEPGNADSSLLPKVDAIRNPDGGISPDQMPPVLVRKVDPKAAAVTEWINALPP